MNTIHSVMPRTLRWASVAVMLSVLAACSTTPQRAPVEERGTARSTPTATTAPAPSGTAAAPSEAPKPPPPGAENAGKPGFYTVKPGDTLMRIALETGQSWRDIAKWNNVDNPNLLEVGQVLRVVAPGADPNGTAARGVAPPPKVEGRPLDAKPVGPSASGPAPVAAPGASAPTPATTPVRDGDDDLSWSWPSGSALAVPFDESRNKGVIFAGKAGDPVLAAADGRVVYAGSGLRGYGNFVILKHNANYLSVYAHNQTLLVKEDQPVRRGQKIAEMGSSDAERVQLHFEIRRQGKPVDPTKLLPPR